MHVAAGLERRKRRPRLSDTAQGASLASIERDTEKQRAAQKTKNGLQDRGENSRREGEKIIERELEKVLAVMADTKVAEEAEQARVVEDAQRGQPLAAIDEINKTGACYHQTCQDRG